jgi:hypothetical protein
MISVDTPEGVAVVTMGFYNKNLNSTKMFKIADGEPNGGRDECPHRDLWCFWLHNGAGMVHDYESAYQYPEDSRGGLDYCRPLFEAIALAQRKNLEKGIIV